MMWRWLWRACLLAPLLSLAHGHNLRLPTLDGQRTVSLDAYKGRALLLNFWSSDCLPCVRELPLLQAQSQLQALPYIGIAIDEPGRAAAFARDAGVRYLQLAAAPAGRAALLRRFGNRLGALPYTVVLDGAHRLCATRLGAVDAAWLARAVQACG